MQNAAMLWTGGKDCSLALYEARRDGYNVRCLVTDGPSFTRAIRICSHSKRIKYLLAYLEIHELELAAP